MAWSTWGASIVVTGALAMATPASAQGTAPASTPAVADPARTPDAAFVAKAVDAVALDTALATLGASRAKAPALQALARRVLEARKAMAGDLEGMSDTRQLRGPAIPETTPPAPTPVATLRAQPAAAFDAAFVTALLTNAEAAVSLFDAESRDGRDDEIKEWAAKQLPVLREHVATLRTLRQRPGS